MFGPMVTVNRRPDTSHEYNTGNAHTARLRKQKSKLIHRLYSQFATCSNASLIAHSCFGTIAFRLRTAFIYAQIPTNT
jgi:hypothetical protein